MEGQGHKSDGNGSKEESDQEIIARHSKVPFNYGLLEGSDSYHYDIANQLCGDSLHLSAKLDHFSQLNLAFTAEGCSLCRASASILLQWMAENSTTRPLDLIAQIEKLLAKLRENPPTPFAEDFWAPQLKAPAPFVIKSLDALLSMRKFASRLRCLTLGFEGMDLLLRQIIAHDKVKYTNRSETMKKPLITRFAPSPTGHLHLGHVASAIYVWGLAKKLGARVLLRIEDHDLTRCKKDYEDEIFSDLTWLGFVDHQQDLLTQHTSGFRRQSDHQEDYLAAFRQLRQQNHLFACQCSRQDIARSHHARPSTDSSEIVYPGTCRNLGLSIDEALKGAELSIRIHLPESSVTFLDLRHGTITQSPHLQCGDFVIRDRHGNWTYSFAAAVDDWRQGVNLIIRGDDLLHATGRQFLLAQILGRTAEIVTYHHPLVLVTHGSEQGRKLGKRFHDKAIAPRRQRGENANLLLGEAAAAVGLIPKVRPIKIDEIAELFSTEP